MRPPQTLGDRFSSVSIAVLMVDFILIDMAAGPPTSGQISTSLLMPGALEKKFGWATTVLLAFARVIVRACRTWSRLPPRQVGTRVSSENAVKIRPYVY